MKEGVAPTARPDLHLLQAVCLGLLQAEAAAPASWPDLAGRPSACLESTAYKVKRALLMAILRGELSEPQKASTSLSNLLNFQPATTLQVLTFQARKEHRRACVIVVFSGPPTCASLLVQIMQTWGSGICEANTSSETSGERQCGQYVTQPNARYSSWTMPIFLGTV